MKIKKNKKKVFKGMTLIEVIVSIAVLAIMTSVLVVTSKSIQSFLRASEDINDRVAVQAPVAQAGDGDTAYLYDQINIIVSPFEDDSSKTITITADVYSVYDDDEMADHGDEIGGGLNMKFIDKIETPTVDPASIGTEAPTEAETT